MNIETETTNMKQLTMADVECGMKVYARGRMSGPGTVTRLSYNVNWEGLDSRVGIRWGDGVELVYTEREIEGRIFFDGGRLK